MKRGRKPYYHTGKKVWVIRHLSDNHINFMLAEKDPKWPHTEVLGQLDPDDYSAKFQAYQDYYRGFVARFRTEGAEDLEKHAL